MADREKALTMWAAGDDADLIADVCGYACGRRIHDMIKLARLRGDARAFCRKRAPRGWPAERIISCRDLVATGLSAAQVAKALKVTRNAVIGQCSRRGFQLRGRRGEYLTANRSEVRRAVVARSAPHVVAGPAVPDDPDARAIWNYFQEIDRKKSAA